MTTAVKKVLKAAMELTDSERVELVDELIATIDAVNQGELSPAWKAEIQRRSREIDAREVKGIPWSEVKARLENRAQEHD